MKFVYIVAAILYFFMFAFIFTRDVRANPFLPSYLNSEANGNYRYGAYSLPQSRAEANANGQEYSIYSCTGYNACN